MPSAISNLDQLAIAARGQRKWRLVLRALGAPAEGQVGFLILKPEVYGGDFQRPGTSPERFLADIVSFLERRGATALHRERRTGTARLVDALWEGFFRLCEAAGKLEIRPAMQRHFAERRIEVLFIWVPRTLLRELGAASVWQALHILRGKNPCRTDTCAGPPQVPRTIREVGLLHLDPALAAEFSLMIDTVHASTPTETALGMLPFELQGGVFTSPHTNFDALFPRWEDVRGLARRLRSVFGAPRRGTRVACMSPDRG